MNQLKVLKKLDQNNSGKKYFNKREKLVNLIMLIMNNYQANQAKHYIHNMLIYLLVFHKRK